MEVMFILIGISVVMAAGFLSAFIWAMRSGQFDDTTTPAIRMLFEDKNFPENTRRDKNHGKI